MQTGRMMGGGTMGVAAFAESATAASSSATAPGVVGQADGTTWDATKIDKSDASMMISYGTRRSLQTCMGGLLAVVTVGMMVFFLFFDAEAIIFGVRHCQDVLCRRGHCIELGDRAECECPRGYSGTACESAQIFGAAYADGVVADCSVLLGSVDGVTNDTALARAMTSFDGSFTFSIPDIDVFISTLPSVGGVYRHVFVVVMPGDRCRGIGTNVYMPAPMVLRVLAPASGKDSIESSLVGSSLAVTPLSTIAWGLDTSTGSTTITDVRETFGVAGDAEYRMDAGSVNFLSRNCGVRCVRAFCNSVKVQNTVAVLQQFLSVESGSEPAWKSIVFGIADELSRTASATSYSLADEDTINRAVDTAYSHMLGGISPTTTASEEFQVLMASAVNVLTIANSGIDAACEALEQTPQSQFDTRMVTEAAQKTFSVIGPIGNETSANMASVVRSIGMEMDAYRAGEQINTARLGEFSDSQLFHQQVDDVVLPRKTVHSTTGTVVSDGYFQNCRVYVDINRDNIWSGSDDEPSAITNAAGQYTITLAHPHDPISSLVEPSAPVRISREQGGAPPCVTSVKGQPPEHTLSGTVSDAAISPTTSLAIGGTRSNQDAIAQCIRSTVQNCVDPLVTSSQIEITLWILSALLDGDACGESQVCLRSKTWATWQTLSASTARLMNSTAGDSFPFADSEYMTLLFNTALEVRGGLDDSAGAIEPLAELASRLNTKAATEARELARPIVCMAADEIVGGTCTEMAGNIDGGKAIVQLMRRQVLAREMRTQLAIQVNAFGDEGRFRGQISSIESQQEEKLATLGKPAPRSY